MKVEEGEGTCFCHAWGLLHPSSIIPTAMIDDHMGNRKREERSMSELKYRRILLKLGGEALAGEGGFGINPRQAEDLAAKVIQVINMGVQIAIVIGGGNIWRGKEDGLDHGMERVTADHMGMLATVMNSLALQDALERQGIPTRVMTGIEVRAVAEPYIQRRAVRHLEKGRVVIFGAGTGNPYFTTDTAASLRAMEIDAETLVKATKVDAVYDSDPKKNVDARPFTHLTYIDALNMRVGVMDSTAMAMCMDNDLPIYVVNLWHEGTLEKVVRGEPVGTMISA
jgi:uridylate kinase